MKNLILAEIKKTASRKALFLVIVLLLLINAGNILKINAVYLPSSPDYLTFSVQDKINAKYEGKITNEKLIELQKDINAGYSAPGADVASMKIMFENMWNALKETVSGKEKINSLMSVNEELKGHFEASGNTYGVAQCDLVEKTYSGRQFDVYYATDGYNTLFNYGLTSFLLLFIVIFFSSSVFTMEKEAGLMGFMLGTVNGRIPLSIAKIITSVLLTSCVSVIFYSVEFITFMSVLGLRGLSAPCYIMRNFFETPLNVSIGEFILILYALKIFGMIVFSLLSLTISSLSKKNYSAFLISFFVAVFLMYICAYSNGIFDVINIFNPIALLTTVEYLKYFDVRSFFGMPIFSYVSIILGGCLFAVFQVVLILIINNKCARGKKYAP